MEISFRKLTSDESDVYRHIRLTCLKKFPENFGSNYEDEKNKEKLFFQPYIENSNTETFVIGGFDQKNLLAICGFERFSNKKISHRGRIIQVYVVPQYKGKKIGYNLIQTALDHAFKIDGLEQIEIGVLSSNLTAEKLYDNLGFKSCYSHENFLKIAGKYLHHIMMKITLQEFEKIRKN